MNTSTWVAIVAALWFVWTDENGVLNLTDDPNNVPAMYIERMEHREVKPLCTYPKLTCVGKCPPCPKETDAD